MLTEKKKAENLRRKARENIRESVLPSPEEAKKKRWKPLYDPGGDEIIGYLKPNGDAIFADGTYVRVKSIEVVKKNEEDPE